MDLANLTDAEVRAVMALHRLRRARLQYADAIAEAEDVAEQLSETDAKAVRQVLAGESTRAAEAIEEARARLAKRKELMERPRAGAGNQS